VTGAGGGFGRLICNKAGALGAKVTCADINVDAAEETAEQVRKAGGTAQSVAADVADIAQMRKVAKLAIATHGGIDIMVNNAGIMPLSPLANRRVDEWDRMIDVNIKGVLYGIDAVLTHMLERKDGHVINVSSVAGLMTNPTSAVYSGTKHAVKAISEGLRKETAGVIRVTTIYPGKVNTELGFSIKDPAVLAGIGDRFNYTGLEVEDIAEAVH
ncbi:MAG: SDR family oxidoreductase, partial [Verrucomicrobiae bacterium]|nr:SDR family oxidoreductase [Verrucomicrobiae bacterium]